MDDKTIKSILQDALEDEVPASQIDLLSAVQLRLAAEKQFSYQHGAKMKQRYFQRIAFSALAIALLLSITLVTPQGRAFAQSVLQFFTRTDSKTFKLEPSQIVPVETAQAEQTASPPSSLISVAEAEAQIGFDVLELPSVPPGFKYLGARLYGKTLNIEYEALGGGGNLIITQSQDGFYQSKWGDTPADAITSVKIHNVDGEFAKGTFVVYPNDTVATWNPDAPILRLRWVKDDIWFEMTKFGNVERIEYFDQEELIKLAESLQ